MTQADNITKKIEQMNFKSSAAMRERILTDASKAMEQTINASAQKPNAWRTIMQSKITKFATAAIIVFAVFIGMNMLNGTPAWAEIVQKFELSYNQYHEALKLAIEANDLEKASINADSLSEFWQGIHVLAEAKLDPALSLRPEDSLDLIESFIGKSDYEDIDQDTFQHYANEFLNWFSQIEDKAWIYDVIHISKEMEEYAEEIRDAGRDQKLGLPYVEHCQTSFLTYSQWFEQLPWDNPRQIMAPAVALMAIERDLTIARKEIETMQRGDADRVGKRCMQQALRNCRSLKQKIKTGHTPNQWRQCHQLTQKVDQLSGLMTYLAIEMGDMTLTNKPHDSVKSHQILMEEFGKKESFTSYFLEQVEQAFDLCDQLHEGFKSK